MSLLIQYTLLFSSVLLLVALGGCFSEHSGVINLGLEGIMVIGALGGALTMRYLPEDTSSFVTFVAVAGASLLAGMLFSVLLAVPAIHLRADQTIIGTAMNMLATAFATVLVKAINTAANSGDVSSEIFYGPARSKMLITIGGFEFNWFVVLSVVVLAGACLVLYKTRFGLRLMACGEYPQAAASVGISVYKMRWAGVLISGALGGLGGIAYITCSVSRWKFENGVAGFGFLALAVMIFGQWKPLYIGAATLLYGMLRALSNVYSGFSLLESLHLPGGVYNMLPYIISIVVLAFTSKRSRAPKSEGIPYDKSMR